MKQYIVIFTDENGTITERVNEDVLIKRLSPEEDYYATSEGTEIHTEIPLSMYDPKQEEPDWWPDGLWIFEATVLVPGTDPETGVTRMMTDGEREYNRTFTLEGHLDRAILTANQCQGNPRECLEAAVRDLVSEGHTEYGGGVEECRIGENRILYIKTSSPDMLTLMSGASGEISIQTLEGWKEWATEQMEEGVNANT